MKIWHLAIATAMVALSSGAWAQQVPSPSTAVVLEVEDAQLSPYETRQLYGQSKLTVTGGKVTDECNTTVFPTITKLSLGLPTNAILVTIPDEACFSRFGKSANKYLLFQRQGTTFKNILTITGNSFKPVTSTTSGVTDIQVGPEGLFIPTWKWDGTKYSYGTNLKSDVAPSPTAPVRMEFDIGPGLTNPLGPQ